MLGVFLDADLFLGGVLVQRIPIMQAEGAVLLKKNLIYNNKKLY
jgi:hypothetical protein